MQWYALGWLVGCQLIRAAGQIISLKFGTSLLAPAQWASVAQVVSLGNIFLALALNPLWYYLARAFHGWQLKGTLRLALRYYLLWIALASIAAAGISWVLQLGFGLIAGLPAMTVAAAVGLTLAMLGISNMAYSGLNLAGSIAGYAIFSSIPIWVGLALAITLVRFSHGPAGWIVGQALGWGSGLFGVVWLWRRVAPTRIKAAAVTKPLPMSLRAAWSFAWPQVIVAVLWWFHSDANRFLLQWIGGSYVVGLFVAAYQLGYYPVRMGELLIQALCDPTFYRRLHDPGDEAPIKAIESYSAFMLPMLIMVGVEAALAGPFLARLLLGPAFRVVGPVVFLAAISETLRAVNYLWYLVGCSITNLRVMILPVAAGAVVVCCGIVVLGRWDPVRGSLLAMVLGTSTVAIVGNFWCRRQRPFRWPVRRMLLGFGLSLPAAAVLYACNLAFPHPSAANAGISLAIAGICAVPGYLYFIYSPAGRQAMAHGTP